MNYLEKLKYITSLQQSLAELAQEILERAGGGNYNPAELRRVAQIVDRAMYDVHYVVREEKE